MSVYLNPFPYDNTNPLVYKPGIEEFPTLTEGFCGAVQYELRNICSNGAYLKYKTGLLDALISPYNTQGFNFDPEPGVIRNKQIIYSQRYSPDAIIESDTICDSGVTPVYNATIAQPQLPLNAPITVDDRAFEQFCSGKGGNYIAMEILKGINALKASLNAKLWTKILNGWTDNIYYGGTTVPSTPLAPEQLDFINNDGSPNYANIIKLKNEVGLLGCDYPILVGANDHLSVLNTYSTVGCCQATSGVNTQYIPSYYYFNYDEYPRTNVLTIDPQTVLALVPGMYQLVRWYRNDTMEQRGNTFYGYVYDPDTGLGFDLYQTYTDCKIGEVKINIHCWYDLVMLARDPDFFAATDPAYGTLGGFLLKV